MDFEVTVNGFIASLNSFFLLCALSVSPLANAADIVDYGASPVFKFFPNPELPMVGEAIKIFAQADYSFGPQQELAPEFILDNATFTPVQTTESLWILSVPAYHEVKSHFLAVNVYVRNAKEAGQIRAALNENEADLQEIIQMISTETDPAKLAYLQAQKSEKEKYRTRLNAQLTALRVFLKSEGLSFSVNANPANPAYPNATAVSPGTGAKAGGTQITITGTNFPTTGTNPTVKVGGRNCTFQSRSATQVVATTSGTFPTTGIKDIEIIFPGSPQKNTILKNAFFVTNP